MDTLRRRIPFKLSEDDDTGLENDILDEQEQEELIDELRRENENVNHAYSIALKVLVGLSCILHVTTINHNPLFSIFPIQGNEVSIPLPAIFTILALYIHFNLVLLFFSNEIRIRFNLSGPIDPLSFQLLYSLSAVAPTLCLFLQKPWQITAWWCETGLIVFIVHTVMDAIQQSNQGIAELETMKYTAPGA
ncbi:hypothetical protein JR316_0007005 [Psilocybe cubensis]|uniref:Uncharacterized protein n=2 Tax=Psilocybe cubensis TaxID=181762 RepID=A0ACB8GY96_PSICU|nr:hypothetical protein JR316_0007005 [Psilocybe cubensis]KAH9480407.1 hypothetical protein JR316_0007005 [Psilocybe cubensis]